ncbi:tetratricopeptide repeat protein [Xanthomonas arboricola]|uniref:tetratricopeptide repeat protein n=1 Tax=Xanthomonas arboricola TaxID=56448 RepID=UPI003EBC2D8E
MKQKSLCILGLFWTITAIGSGCTPEKSAPHPDQASEAVSRPEPRGGKALANQGKKSPDIKVKPLTGKAYVIEDFGSPPAGSAAEAVKSLEASAKNGDSNASYSIYLKVRECLTIINSSKSSNLPSDAEAFEQCKDLPTDYYATAGDWLQLAAEQGSVPAQLLYASDPAAVVGDPSNMLRDPVAVQRYKDKALTYLNQAVDSGSVDAVLRLANTYKNGILVKQDAGTSYAYYEAARMASPATVPTRTMEDLAQGLSSREMANSAQKGREIYERCCKQ